MATRYVWSGATGSGTGADWTNAYTTYEAARAASAAGDDIRVAHDHAETASSSAAVSYSNPGTRTNPLQVLCVNSTNGLVTTGASIKTVGAYNLTVTAANATAATHQRGMKYTAGDAASAAAKMVLTRSHTFRDCTFETATTGAGAVELNGNFTFQWENCWVKQASSTSSIQAGWSGPNTLTWRGGGVLSGHNCTVLLTQNFQSTIARLSSLDLSAMPGSASIFTAIYETCEGTIRDSKLPTGWSGSLYSGTVTFGSRFGMYNCDSGDTNYNLIIADYAGTIVDETAIYRTDGFKLRDQSNAAIGYALKVTTNASTHELLAPLRTDPLIRNYPGTSAEQAGFTPGASKTVSVEITHSAAAALTDAQVWLDVDYLGTDGNPLGVTASNQRASPLATPATHATSTEAWSGTAQTYKQKLSVTISPQAPGVIEARVCLATGNGVVVYVDPMITVS